MVLLDASVLIALGDDDHIFHQPARHWFAALDEPFATCPITQGSLIRHALRVGKSMRTGLQLLFSFGEHPSHEFLPDDLSYQRVSLELVTGHAHVTDAYLVALARHHGTHLATFDRSLAAMYPDVVDLVPTA